VTLSSAEGKFSHVSQSCNLSQVPAQSSRKPFAGLSYGVSTFLTTACGNCGLRIVLTGFSLSG